MSPGKYEQVCYRTEQREEDVVLHNLNTGRAGHAFGCTTSGETVQVRLEDGSLDSWNREECTEIKSESW
jgi:hypothetical protein